MSFLAQSKPDGSYWLTHKPTETRMPIDAATFEMLAELLRIEPDTVMFCEQAADVMCEGGYLAYDDFNGCLDTPDNIAEYAREAAIAYEQDRGLLAWYHGRVL